MRQIFRTGLWTGLVLLIAACATLSENKLPQNKRDALRIDSVDVSFAPDAFINWPDVFYDYPASQPGTPAGRIAFLQQRAGGKIRSNVEAQIRPAFRGSEPARLKVVIRRLEVPSVLQRILIGGGNVIAAEITLTDAKTGQVLLNAEFTGTAYAGGGFSAIAVDAIAQEAIVRVSTNFGEALAKWLKTGSAF
jgi:hypothetical protein